MNPKQDTSHSLAVAITKAASKQTYYTIRFFVDRSLVPDAYRAYGYFRWVDDILDSEAGSKSEKLAFVERQKSLLDSCYQGEIPGDLCSEEVILVDLVRNDTQENSGLQAYLRNMMAVMDFDAQRRGQLISQLALDEYTLSLATAVTEAMHYFIGHDSPSPRGETRYQAVTAAHVIHMLRDAIEDSKAGYFNIPREYLQAKGISAHDVNRSEYRRWVCGRVTLARRHFQAGRAYLARLKNLRCRLAGYAYAARFEWMLRAIERDNFCLRSAYPQRKGLSTSLWMVWTTLASMVSSLLKGQGASDLTVRPVRIQEL
jgi:phytoene/squalene synthetase